MGCEQYEEKRFWPDEVDGRFKPVRGPNGVQEGKRKQSVFEDKKHVARRITGSDDILTLQ